jgi:hypothetical protein
MTMSPVDVPLSSRPANRTLSEVLRALETSTEARFSLNALITSLGNRSFVPLLILFALPNLFFFVPGSSVITGPPLIFVAGQLVLGRPSVWLPRAVGERTVEREAFLKITSRAIPWIERVERLVHPRYWVLSHRASELTVGMACLVMSIFMFLPIPFGNTLPALSVIMMALSLSERDGLWLLGGFVLSIASFAVVAAIFAAGAFAMVSFF